MSTTINLDIDLKADITGFSSAKRVTPAHRKLMNYYCSPFFYGPKPSDEVLELIAHIYTEEEAEIVQHLPPFYPRTAKRLSSITGNNINYVKPILDNLADNKVVLLSFGEPRKYTIMPIVPGTFECALMTIDIKSRNRWHQRFAELFEQLWNKGDLIIDYLDMHPSIRFLPVNRTVNSLHSAWPSDKLDQVLDRFDIFAVGNCQCRLAMEMVGKGCGKPLETCSSYGDLARIFIDKGLMRQVDKQELIEIKHHAEEQGCITWMINERGGKYGNGSCSCCGCCCHALRTVTQFNTPGLISEPHFYPKKDSIRCTSCNHCVDVCPMNAWKTVNDSLLLDQKRCIGCGLCVINCPFNALSLDDSEKAKPPENSLITLLMKIVPGYVYTSAKVWASRFVKQL